MGLCLGFVSALQYWLTKRGDEAIPEAADTGRFAHSEASSRLLAHEHLPLEPSEKRPLHLLVPSQALKHRLDNIVVHACSSKLPAGSFYRLGGDNLVASPALTFLQMAPRHSLWELVEIGCYLCSKFSISERGRDYVGEREQLVTLDELHRYIDSLPNRAYGKRQATRALSYVVELTASPKETHLAMHYGMPLDLGGRGPIAISANQRINIDEHGQRILEATHLVGDLYLSEYKSDLEYDSIEFHTGSYRLDHTQARRNVLEAMQIKTISATQGQIDTLQHFDDFTWLMESRIGREHVEADAGQRQAQKELFAWTDDKKRVLF